MSANLLFITYTKVCCSLLLFNIYYFISSISLYCHFHFVIFFFCYFVLTSYMTAIISRSSIQECDCFSNIKVLHSTIVWVWYLILRSLTVALTLFLKHHAFCKSSHASRRELAPVKCEFFPPLVSTHICSTYIQLHSAQIYFNSLTAFLNRTPLLLHLVK